MKKSPNAEGKARSAKALRESENKYRELVQSANSAIIRYKHDGTISFFNEYAQKFFGYREEEVIGKSVHIIVPAKDSAGGDLTKLREEVLSQPEKYVNNINENVCRDGSRVWMTWTNKAVLDEEGQVVEILAIGNDITALVKAEAAAKAERKTAEQYFNIAGVILIALDADARIMRLNRKGYQILGYEDGELDGKDWLRVCLGGQDYERVYGVYRKIVTGEIDPFEYYENDVLTKKGERRCIAWHNALIRDEQGRITGTLSSGEDITGRKQAAEALQKAHDELEDRVKDRTATLRALAVQLDQAEEAERERIAQVLHDELQQILTGARFALGSLKAESGPERDRQHILGIVDSYLEKAQQSMRTLCSDLHPLILNEVDVDAVLNGLKHDMQQNFSLTVEVNVDDAVELTTANLRRLVFQAVRELLLNVVKHAGVKSARVRMKPIDADRILIEVKDAGTGFNATQQRQRTSLGLAWIRERVDYIGGQMKIQSAPGKGTCITLTLPRI